MILQIVVFYCGSTRGYGVMNTDMHIRIDAYLVPN